MSELQSRLSAIEQFLQREGDELLYAPVERGEGAYHDFLRESQRRMAVQHTTPPVICDEPSLPPADLPQD